MRRPRTRAESARLPVGAHQLGLAAPGRDRQESVRSHCCSLGAHITSVDRAVLVIDDPSNTSYGDGVGHCGQSGTSMMPATTTS